MNDDAKILARNLKKLMEYHQHTQMDVHRISGVAQKTVSNILNPGDNTSPTLANVGAIARAYKLQPWHLLIDNLPDDMLYNSSIEKIVENVVMSDKVGRDTVLQISETTAHYNSEPKKIGFNP